MDIRHLILDQLERSHSGEAWHGPALLETLSSVSAPRAAAHPLPGRHSIWEIVLHLRAWEATVLARLQGTGIRDLPPELDWPPVETASESAWETAREDLRVARSRLVAAVGQLDPARLGQPLWEGGASALTTLLGLAQHDAYHGGQIVLLQEAS